jgi:hypothetical protein
VPKLHVRVLRIRRSTSNSIACSTELVTCATRTPALSFLVFRCQAVRSRCVIVVGAHVNTVVIEAEVAIVIVGPSLWECIRTWASVRGPWASKALQDYSLANSLPWQGSHRETVAVTAQSHRCVVVQSK